jgi:hypothetical protein
MVYKLILDEMYVVCSEFDVSGVTCDWMDYKLKIKKYNKSQKQVVLPAANCKMA